MTIYRTAVEVRPAVHAGGTQKATGFNELPPDLSRRLDRVNQSKPISPSTRPPSNLSTRRRAKATSSAGVFAGRILAVLWVAVAVTSIVALKVFGDNGNVPAALVAGAIASFSAVLGAIIGFMKAYQSSS
jgi:hypothetical protein